MPLTAKVSAYLFNTPAFLRVSSKLFKARMSVAGSSAAVFVLLPPRKPENAPKSPPLAGSALGL